MTTRQPRKGEIDGRDYRFVDQDHFFALRDARLFAEHASVHGAWYGTPLTPIREAARAGKRAVILPIDFQGGARLEADFQDVVQVLLIPPSLEELRRRLVNRGTDPLDTVERRLAMADVEMRHYTQASHVIVNHDPQQAARELHIIMEAERLRRCSQKRVEAVLAGETLVP
jgi:guanylate kinase